LVTAYLTATEFRNITNLQSTEYSDTQLNQMILSATVEIDKQTGRANVIRNNIKKYSLKIYKT
jgi:hypothetical protein